MRRITKLLTFYLRGKNIIVDDAFSSDVLIRTSLKDVTLQTLLLYLSYSYRDCSFFSTRRISSFLGAGFLASLRHINFFFSLKKNIRKNSKSEAAGCAAAAAAPCCRRAAASSSWGQPPTTTHEDVQRSYSAGCWWWWWCAAYTGRGGGGRLGAGGVRRTTGCSYSTACCCTSYSGV